MEQGVDERTVSLTVEVASMALLTFAQDAGEEQDGKKKKDDKKGKVERETVSFPDQQCHVTPYCCVT